MSSKNTNHSNRKHALLSASGSDRWINCTPSARLEEKFDESTSVYAAEGTLAHEFADIKLRHISGEITQKVYDSEVKKLRKEKLYTDEMEPEVDKYVDYVIETFNVARSKTPGAVLLIEEHLDFSHLVESGFGTGDSGIIANGVVDIIDLKYGKGVKVFAENNSQAMLYGAGALREYELLYDIHTIRLTIVQPRLDHIDTWDISVKDLESWGSKTVKPKAKKAYEGKGTQKAGSWCKWCKVKGMCATLAAKNVKLAQHEFADPHFLTRDQQIDVYKQIPMLMDWAKSVASHLLKEALAGEKIDGFKLVLGKTNRKWIDQEKVKEILYENDFNDYDFINSNLGSITTIEKLVGKSKFYKLLGKQIHKPQGAPTLVDNSDNRLEYTAASAKDDFKS